LTELMRPAAEWELQSMISKLAAQNRPVEVIGHGGLRAMGRPPVGDVAITTASLRGITLYEPNELVMSVRAGTPLIEVQSALAANKQMLAFEPMDLGPATGGRADSQTIGGVFATNLSGSRRIAAGSARDSLLGVSAVNGRAEHFKSGGRVMKNVTGYDVARGLTGSWGTLAIMTEVTFKVMPLQEMVFTLAFPGLPDDLAIELLTKAMATPFEVSGAAHLPKGVVGRLTHPRLRSLGDSLTLLRLENFAASIAYRKEKLKEALKVYGVPAEFGPEETISLWNDLRTLAVMPFSDETSLWRISTIPAKAPEIVAAIQKFMPSEAFYDWSGGLIWLEVPAAADAGAADVRRAVAVRGGHALLVRAAPEVRNSVEVFEPMKPEIERLTRGLKTAFDPSGLLNPGRMYANI
jgi:glycolate oxidase FAD binding subunit